MEASIASTKQPPMEAAIPIPTLAPVLRPDADWAEVEVVAKADVGVDVDAADVVDLEVVLLKVDDDLADRDERMDVDGADDVVVAVLGQIAKLGSHTLLPVLLGSLSKLASTDEAPKDIETEVDGHQQGAGDVTVLLSVPESSHPAHVFEVPLQ